MTLYLELRRSNSNPRADSCLISKKSQPGGPDLQTTSRLPPRGREIESQAGTSRLSSDYDLSVDQIRDENTRSITEFNKEIPKSLKSPPD